MSSTSTRRIARGKSVLVIEDDTDIREALCALLGDEGFAVTACANGLVALEKLRSGASPDVILLDLMMPVMDGWQFRVRQKNDPKLAHIPVLALSADVTAKAEAIDADAYLKKPVDYDALLGAIERAVTVADERRLHAKQAETARLSALGTLAAGVAHEINNPLAYVTLNLEIAARALSTDGDGGANVASEVRAAVDEARAGCERIRTIVRDLQLFSRPGEDTTHPIDVRAVLDSSANVVASEVRARAHLTRDYGAVPLVDANDTRLAQVFVNLILNAAQSIPEGNVGSNEVRLTTSTDDAGRAVIEVQDTGSGIPADVRAHIFDPFFTTKPVGIGTGLGLSIVHRIVSALHGSLDVLDRAGGGTTFRVTLPPSAVATSPASGRGLGATAPARRARILVIDDEPRICAMIARVLEPLHDVDTTTRGDEAIARIKGGARFDLILCDLMMPDMTGMDVHQAVAAVDAKQARRMLFLTGGAFTPRSKQFLAEVSASVIEKPFSAADLVDRIASSVAAFDATGELASGG